MMNRKLTRLTPVESTLDHHESLGTDNLVHLNLTAFARMRQICPVTQQQHGTALIRRTPNRPDLDEDHPIMKIHFFLNFAVIALVGTAAAQIEPSEGYKPADMVFGPIPAEASKEDAWQIRPHRITAFSQIEILDPSGTAIDHRYVPRADSLGGDVLTEILFLIDTSDPTRKKDVHAAREIAVDLMKQAPKHCRFGVGIIGENLSLIHGVDAEQPAVQLALMEEGHYSPRQNTRLYWALVQAMDAFPQQQPTTRRLVVVFSDGVAEDNPQGYSANDVIVAAKKKNIGIVTVALVTNVSQETFANSLKTLSYGTGSPAIKLKPQTRGTKYVLADDVKARFFEHLDTGGELYIPRSETRRALKLKLTTSLAESYEVDLYQSASVASAGDGNPDETTPADQAEQPDEQTDQADDNNPDGEKSPEEVNPDEPTSESPPAEESVATEDQGGFTPMQWTLVASCGLIIALAITWFVLRMRRKPSAAATTGNTYLELADNAGVRYPVSGSAIRIGRGQENDIRLANNSVSKHHAEILRNREGKLLITDLSSGNGVFVNGNRVDSAELFHGDLIELGEVHLIVRNP